MTLIFPQGLWISPLSLVQLNSLHYNVATPAILWNLSNPVTFGPKTFGLITDVAAITMTSLEQSLTKIGQIGHFMKAHHL